MTEPAVEQAIADVRAGVRQLQDGDLARALPWFALAREGLDRELERRRFLRRAQRLTATPISTTT